MLDALGIGNGTKKQHKSAAEELQTLINTAREERSALSEMLTQVSMRSTKLPQTQKALEQIEKIANQVMGRANEVEGRLVSLDGRAKALEEIDLRIATLLSTVQKAQQAADE